MIKISYIYKTMSGVFKETYIIFNDVKKALRFLYAIKKKAYNIEWVCNDVNDNNYLIRNFK